MSSKATNLGLLGLVFLQVATGIGAFMAGAPTWQVVVWAHAAGGFSIVLLFYWKRRIITRSLTRRPVGPWAAPALGLLLLILAALATGIGFSTAGLPYLAGYSPMTLHALLGVGALAVLVFHARARWPRVRRRDVIGRRALLRSGLLLAGGAALWRGAELSSVVLGLSGAGRRFTGSRRAASFSGNDFPTSTWLTDHPDALDLNSWRLRMGGHVRSGAVLTLTELAPRATSVAVLDCTGGWYSEQAWNGVPLAELLDAAGVKSGARSVVVRASTGYWRRYTLAEARRSLLATHVGGEPLTHEHGAPLRLVIPGKRGYEWVKWVVAVEVSTATPLLKWPLPIS